MRLYVAGPMRGHDKFNFPAFDAARDLLTGLGVEPISPADLDRAEGFDPEQEGYDFDILGAMRRDIAVIIDPETDGIVRLLGWQTSQGVAVEMTVNRAVGGRVYDVVYDGGDYRKMVGIEEVAG